MTPFDKMEAMQSIFKQALALAGKKGNDYSGKEDAMRNFRTFGWKGIVVRLEDKMQRLITFAKGDGVKVKDESLEDTLLDHINYACLCLIAYREEQGSNNQFAGCAGQAKEPPMCGGTMPAPNPPPLDKKPVCDGANNVRFRNMLDNIIFLDSLMGAAKR